MANPYGYHSHGTKGGKYKRKNSLDIDFGAFGVYAEQLDNLGADLKSIFEKAMEEEAKKVERDTIDAMDAANLPAQGKYSQGDTLNSIVRDAKVTWEGSVGEIPLGFDKTKSGAGGFLITGTPRMRPNMALEDIYGRKKYEQAIVRRIKARLDKEIKARLGG